ncbi:outer membrane beta-barrel protein [Zunongwangia profunda]|uniref:outer membrane beta-barrel protein n=1 Tax=Zunongwangia profunda TaxID=398743 RepID=UPI000A033925|nr:outer membrane beta-barrel family protein [Zunongwangia profunda]MAS69068.1 TonB-dependent receptor [Zunongwangia sp.]|tara:strand:- start:514 stop:2949 length:2436 start_codon:yes stop_codon:yes gene_type:complete
MKTFLPLILLAFIVFIPNRVFSQNQVRGQIVDKENQPVSFANVVLLNAKDSVSVIKGMISEDDGSFLFEEIENRPYVLKISFLGFADYIKRFEVEGNTNLGKIELQETSNSLDEVTVKARKPKIERKIDRISFNVENSVISSLNTYEILKRTPGVIVSQGELLVKNRPATVYINDRKVYLSTAELEQLLSGLSGENVKSVEVITTPPARYEAEGSGAILNIVMSKNPSIGYKGSVNASNTVAVLPKYSLGTSQYYKTNNLNAFASYNFNANNIYKNDESNVTYFEPDGSENSTWLGDFERDTKNYAHSLNTILDFTLSEKSSLSLSANLNFTPKNDSDLNGQTDIYSASGSLDSLFTTDSRLENEAKNMLFNADFSTSLGENGAKLSAQVNYIRYDKDQDQDLNTTYFYGNGDEIRNNIIMTRAMQNSDIYTGQVDITTNMGSLPVETGIKYAGITSNSALDFYNNTFALQVDELSDALDYDENIYAAYFSTSKELGKWSLKAGLRGEYTDISGISAQNGLVNDQDYFQLFPTFYAMRSLGEESSISLEYNRRIERPRFQSLNPFQYYINENNVKEGNPALVPGIANKVLFNYSYKGALFFDLYWDRVDHSPSVLSFQDNQNQLLRTVNDNLDYTQQFSLDITYANFVTNWYYLYGYLSGFYMENQIYARESAAETYTIDTFSAFLNVGNYFYFGGDGTFSGNVNTYFLPNILAGSYKYENPQFGLDLGLRKTFMNNKISVSINAEDILRTMNIPMQSQYLNQDNGFYAISETRRITFGVRYNFGNFRLNDNNRAINADEETRLKERQVLD